MKQIIISICVIIFSLTEASAARFEVATIMGTPNEKMPFVQDVLMDYLTFVPGRNFQDYTTGAVYFAWKNGAKTMQAIQVLDDKGTTTMRNLNLALIAASSASSIVIMPLGGGSFESSCQEMAKRTETAFIVAMKAIQSADGKVSAACASGNILPISGLNSLLSDLVPSEPFGAQLKLAVPAVGLSAPVDEGRNYTGSSRGFGMAIAAGKMVQTMRKYPELSGASLINKFLEEETQRLPALEGKVVGARAILSFEK